MMEQAAHATIKTSILPKPIGASGALTHYSFCFRASFGHSLMLMLAGAKGRRASLLRSQIMALEQKLSALNLELEKKKLQDNNTPQPKIT